MAGNDDTWVVCCPCQQMFDSDDIGSDDFMGRVRIPVADVVDDGRVNNKTFPLEEAKKGDVTLSIRWREL